MCVCVCVGKREVRVLEARGCEECLCLSVSVTISFSVSVVRDVSSVEIRVGVSMTVNVIV